MRPFLIVCLCAATALANPPFYPDKSQVMEYIGEDGTRHPVESAADWAIRRRHILENFQLVTGPYPAESKRVALDPVVESETDMGGYVRKKVTIAVEEGDRLPLYLLMPKGGDKPRPAMVCLHQTTQPGKDEPAGIEGLPNLAYAKELAERGYVTIAPDYPNFGEYVADPYTMGYASATMKGIWNHMRCVDYLQSLPEVNPDRIGAIGHSLGGHNTLFLGLMDERVKCMVTSCGFCSFPTYYNGDITGWSHKGYMPRIAEVYEKDPAKMPFDFTEVIAALAPRFVYISAPLRDSNFEWKGVRDCVDAALPVYTLLGGDTYLQVRYPDCEHDFPPEVRNAAYGFIDSAFAEMDIRAKRN